MKVTTEHRDYMAEKIRERVRTYPPEALATYLSEIQADPRVMDWERRYRWDLCHASGLTPWICTTLYPYADDSHIDTALKSIVGKLP